MKLYLQKEIRFVFDSSYVILKNLLWYENYLYYDLIVILHEISIKAECIEYGYFSKPRIAHVLCFTEKLLFDSCNI